MSLIPLILTFIWPLWLDLPEPAFRLVPPVRAAQHKFYRRQRRLA